MSLANWRINGVVPADLKVKSLKIEPMNLGDGSFSFLADGRDIDAAPLFAYREEVVLSGPGGVRWRGPCVRRPVSGSPASESQAYVVASPWWYLDHLVYLQQWKVRIGTAHLGRCILGRTNDGSPMTMAEVITGILEYAQECGAPIAVGDIDLPSRFPVEEVKGLMCSEVIRRVLRWAPDAVGWWTFGATAQFNCQRRSGLTAKALTIGQRPLQKVEIEPRDDMKPSAIVIAYERVDTVDGQPITNVIMDASPPGATGRQIGALLFTIPLAGGSVTLVKQRTVVQTIQIPAGDGDPNASAAAKAYWGRILGLVGKATGTGEVPDIKFFRLGEDGAGKYFIRSLGTVAGLDGPNPYELEDPSDPTSAHVYIKENLPRELIEGAVCKWMSGVEAQRQIIQMKISYTPIGTTMSTKPTVVSVKMVATDATNRVYSKPDSSIAPEEPAVGLASEMMEAFSEPHYDGTITLLEPECSGEVGLGDVLNINGGREAWTGMRAVVQQVSEDLDQGITTLRIGPPAHLGPQDMTELQRCDRRPEGNTLQQNANVGRRASGEY